MLEAYFPNLSPSDYRITSPRTDAHNCIAWAAGDTDNWWWPGPPEETYWPPGVPREPTINAFISAFVTLGYERCQDATLEEGFEKVALYVSDTVPKHAAKQLSNGCWTSKIGELEDISHDSLDSLHGDLYGESRIFLRRPSQSPNAGLMEHTAPASNT